MKDFKYFLDKYGARTNVELHICYIKGGIKSEDLRDFEEKMLNPATLTAAYQMRILQELMDIRTEIRKGRQ